MSSFYKMAEDYCYLEDFDEWEYKNGKFIFTRSRTGMYSSKREVLDKEDLINSHHKPTFNYSARNKISTSDSEIDNSKNIFDIDKNSLIRDKDILLEYLDQYYLNAADKNGLIKKIKNGQFHTLGDLEEQCVRFARRKKVSAEEIEDYANYYCEIEGYNSWGYDEKSPNKIVFKLVSEDGKYVSKMRKIEVKKLTMFKKEVILSMTKHSKNMLM
jgi:hypothetical protein